jgi:hypothetical protein
VLSVGRSDTKIGTTLAAAVLRQDDRRDHAARATARKSVGVIFVEENGDGPGVRLKKRRR